MYFPICIFQDFRRVTIVILAFSIFSFAMDAATLELDINFLKLFFCRNFVYYSRTFRVKFLLKVAFDFFHFTSNFIWFLRLQKFYSFKHFCVIRGFFNFWKLTIQPFFIMDFCTFFESSYFIFSFIF